ncbi:MAG TPA: hypothetical protein VHY35_16470 [Stellaceae bacterium]|nr:hypothetical protein [Stellaceae bacterium]
MFARILVVGAALLLGAAGNAFACQAGTSASVLDDNFKTPDPGWGPADDAASFSAAGLALKPPVNGSAWRWNPNYSIDGHDLCVSVSNPSPLPSRNGDIGDVGLWFWSRDAQNFYTATLSLNGTVSIDRLVEGVWHVVMAPTLTGAVHTNPGGANELEILVKGNTGSFFVNGNKITDFHGEAPPRGGPPGVYGESGSTAVTWVFSRVQLF